MANGKKKPTKKTTKKSYSKKSYFKAKTIVPIKSLTIPRSQLVKIRDVITGYIPNGTASGDYYATVYAGQLSAPFNSLAPITAGNFGSGVVTTGTSINDSFAGFPLMQLQYANYKVYSAKLKFNVRPEGSSDSLFIGAFPWASNNQANLTTMTTDEYAEQPFAKSRAVYSQKDKDGVVLTNKSHQVLGLSKLQYKAISDSNGLTSAPQASMNWNYLIFWQQIDNVALSGNVIFTIELERIVQFYNPNNLLN